MSFLKCGQCLRLRLRFSRLFHFTPPSHYLGQVMTFSLQQNRELGLLSFRSKETFSSDSLPTILCNRQSLPQLPALSTLYASFFLIVCVFFKNYLVLKHVC